MQRHCVKIANDSFVLVDDAARFKAAVLDAVRAGGGIIDVFRDNQSSVSALIAPGIPVLFSTYTVDDTDEDEEPAAAFSLDGYDF